jgi:hypothetical protein
MGDINQVTNDPYQKPPYQMEDKIGRFTTITKDQRCFDTDVYCKELKSKLIKACLSGELPWALDVLFMHDSILPLGNKELDDNGQLKRNWWDEDSFFQSSRSEEPKPEDRVEKYLKDSWSKSYLDEEK